MSENENWQLGYAGDPVVMYGPSAHQIVSDRKAQEEPVMTEAPLDGAQTQPSGEEAAPGSRITPGGFIRKPAGLLLILLPITYIAFHFTFGAGA